MRSAQLHTAHGCVCAPSSASYSTALCKGLEEVREAFRAVQAFSPTAEAPSEIEQIAPNQFVVRTRTRYKVPGWGGKGFVVPSEIIVTTVSEEAAAAAAAANWRGYKEEGEDEDGKGSSVAGAHHHLTTKGKIERIEERWNGARLLEGFPFNTIRRAAGMVSFAATPVFVPSTRRSPQ